MANTGPNLFYKLMNLIMRYPSRQSLEASAAKLEAAQATISSTTPDANRLASQCCCVLWWDESIGRPDEPITVSSETVCQQLAAQNHANYRKPLPQGPCKPL